VAQIGYDGFMRGRRVAVAGFGNRMLVFLVRLFPHGMLLPLLERGTRGAVTRS
jgi:hypothetical protein